MKKLILSLITITSSLAFAENTKLTPAQIATATKLATESGELVSGSISGVRDKLVELDEEAGEIKYEMIPKLLNSLRKYLASDEAEALKDGAFQASKEGAGISVLYAKKATYEAILFDLESSQALAGSSEVVKKGYLSGKLIAEGVTLYLVSRVPKKLPFVGFLFKGRIITYLTVSGASFLAVDQTLDSYDTFSLSDETFAELIKQTEQKLEMIDSEIDAATTEYAE